MVVGLLVGGDAEEGVELGVDVGGVIDEAVGVGVVAQVGNLLAEGGESLVEIFGDFALRAIG